MESCILWKVAAQQQVGEASLVSSLRSTTHSLLLCHCRTLLVIFCWWIMATLMNNGFILCVFLVSLMFFHAGSSSSFWWFWLFSFSATFLMIWNEHSGLWSIGSKWKHYTQVGCNVLDCRWLCGECFSPLMSLNLREKIYICNSEMMVGCSDDEQLPNVSAYHEPGMAIRLDLGKERGHLVDGWRAGYWARRLFQV